MPYLDGRIASISRRMPYDALIEENFHDPNVYHYTPIGFKSFVKFVYRFAFFKLLVIEDFLKVLKSLSKNT